MSFSYYKKKIILQCNNVQHNTTHDCYITSAYIDMAGIVLFSSSVGESCFEGRVGFPTSSYMSSTGHVWVSFLFTGETRELGLAGKHGASEPGEVAPSL